MHRPILFSLLCGLVLASACAPQPQSPATKPAGHYFELQLGTATVYAQMALTDPERTRGLMHRDSLDQDHGMLFVFENAKQRGFWMRNTRIPLDIAYFDDRGRLLEIYPMYPFDETSVPSRSHRIQFALEMDQGWFAENGIRTGAQLPLDTVAEAIEARGQTPATYGLP